MNHVNVPSTSAPENRFLAMFNFAENQIIPESRDLSNRAADRLRSDFASWILSASLSGLRKSLPIEETQVMWRVSIDCEIRHDLSHHTAKLETVPGESCGK